MSEGAVHRRRPGRNHIVIPEGDAFIEHMRRKIEAAMVRSGPDHFLRTREVAQLFGVSLRTVQWWIAGRKLQCNKTPGGHSRITIRDLQKFVSDHPVFHPRLEAVTRTVLVIDSEDETRRLQQLCARKKSLRILGHADPYEALIIAGIERPNTIVVSMDSRHGNWLHYCGALRRMLRLELEQLIAIAPNQRTRNRLLGVAHSVLVRPVESPEILQVLFPGKNDKTGAED
ncbi:MAG: hypothetical protein GMKNLPBB_01557 [Myxococcota bacterium]|nr:hypothetical protein [Myxococcota bacterium]